MTEAVGTRGPVVGPAAWLTNERAVRFLRYAAAFYLVAWAVHTGDHLRRGTSVVTSEVLVLGSGAAV